EPRGLSFPVAQLLQQFAVVLARGRWGPAQWWPLSIHQEGHPYGPEPVDPRVLGGLEDAEGRRLIVHRHLGGVPDGAAWHPGRQQRLRELFGAPVGGRLFDRPGQLVAVTPPIAVAAKALVLRPL